MMAENKSVRGNSDYSSKAPEDATQQLDELFKRVNKSGLLQYTSDDILDENATIETGVDLTKPENNAALENFLDKCAKKPNPNKYRSFKSGPYKAGTDTDKFLVNIKYNILEEKPYSAARSQLETSVSEACTKQPEPEKVYLKPIKREAKHPVHKMIKNFSECKVTKPEPKPLYKRFFDSCKKLYNRIFG
jgi:hypothetical protein